MFITLDYISFRIKYIIQVSYELMIALWNSICFISISYEKRDINLYRIDVIKERRAVSPGDFCIT